MNALCREACFESVGGRDRSRPITADAVLAAQERLILRRDTHIDDLASKLREERVRRVIEPILTGADRTDCSDEDLAYAHDLGLVTQHTGSPPHVANPIYAEVLPRHLNHAVQETLPQMTAWYVDADGGLDVDGLLSAVPGFFREHSEHWVQRFEQYHERGVRSAVAGVPAADRQRRRSAGTGVRAGPGTGRPADRVPQRGRERRIAVECKVRRGGLERTIAEGLAQTRGYLDRCRAEAGHLIVFDRSTERSWEEKIFRPRGADRNGAANHRLGDVSGLKSGRRSFERSEVVEVEAVA